MNAPILVTGGAGFLGSWVVRCLVQRGDVVRVFDLPGARWSQLPRQQAQCVRGDIRDRSALRGALQGCRAVIHVAGLPQLWARPRGQFSQINFHGAVNVLEEAVHAGCQRIVHVSSATVWPVDNAPVGRWCDALGDYGRSKLRAERHALRLASNGAPVAIVSPTAPIGPGDWSRTPPTQMLLDCCLGKRREYLDAPLNLIDVRDAAAAMIAALDADESGRRYLLGSATVSLQELFKKLAAVSGQPAPHRKTPYVLALIASVGMEWWADVISRQAPPACIAAVRLTRRPLPRSGVADLKRLGVAPRSLDETLADTVTWFREAGWLNSA